MVITEKAIIEDINCAVKQIKVLKQAGFKIVIDEFCCGLSYIGKFSSDLIDLVRLDASMMGELDARIEWLCVIEGVLQIAHQLQIETIVTGVNDEYQYKMLQNINSTYWQGDYSYLMNDTEELNLA